MILFSLTGLVIHGNHLGQTLGYPTANLELAMESIAHRNPGVYAVRVHLAGTTYNGMANIGTRPTLVAGGFMVEVHLFDFTGDLYGRTLTVDFIQRIRDEIKFQSLEELKKQLDVDKSLAQLVFSGLFEADPYSA